MWAAPSVMLQSCESLIPCRTPVVNVPEPRPCPSVSCLEECVER